MSDKCLVVPSTTEQAKQVLLQLCRELPLSSQAKGVHSAEGLIQVNLLILNNLVYFHPAWLYLDLTSKIRDLNNDVAHLLYTSDQMGARSYF